MRVLAVREASVVVEADLEGPTVAVVVRADVVRADVADEAH